MDLQEVGARLGVRQARLQQISCTKAVHQIGRSLVAAGRLTSPYQHSIYDDGESRHPMAYSAVQVQQLTAC